MWLIALVVIVSSSFIYYISSLNSSSFSKCRISFVTKKKTTWKKLEHQTPQGLNNIHIVFKKETKKQELQRNFIDEHSKLIELC